MEERRFEITYDKNIPQILKDLNCMLVISTYQAGKVVFIGECDGELSQTPATFKKPMGVSINTKRLAIASLDRIDLFANSPELAKLFPEQKDTYDALFVPRASYYCGEADLHDIHLTKGGVWAVNTRYSCLSTFDIQYNFRIKWKPPFISKVTPEDRCHLNGMAMKDDVPAYVTALGKTDKKEGWRENIISGGILMNVPKGEIILDNLPMPHSPRIINGKLYLLLSATGEVIEVDLKNKTYKSLINLNGFVRGMSAWENYLFIGQSRGRQDSKTFGKLPFDRFNDFAGIHIVDMRDWSLAGTIKYDTTIEEIFDVQLVPEIKTPGIMTIEDERHKNAIMNPVMAFWKKPTKPNVS